MTVRGPSLTGPVISAAAMLKRLTGGSPAPAGASPSRGAVRQRSTRTSSGGAARAAPGSSGGGGLGLFRTYNDGDSTGIQVGPLLVIVASVAFVGSVIFLHIVGKYVGGFSPIAAAPSPSE